MWNLVSLKELKKSIPRDRMLHACYRIVCDLARSAYPSEKQRKWVIYLLTWTHWAKNIFEPLNSSYSSLSFLFTYPLHHQHSWGKVQPSVLAKCFPHCPNNMAPQAHTSLVPSFPSFLSLLIISEGISDFFLIMKSQKWTSLKSWRVIKSPYLC